MTRVPSSARSGAPEAAARAARRQGCGPSFVMWCAPSGVRRACRPAPAAIRRRGSLPPAGPRASGSAGRVLGGDRQRRSPHRRAGIRAGPGRRAQALPDTAPAAPSSPGQHPPGFPIPGNCFPEVARCAARRPAPSLLHRRATEARRQAGPEITGPPPRTRSPSKEAFAKDLRPDPYSQPGRRLPATEPGRSPFPPCPGTTKATHLRRRVNCDRRRFSFSPSPPIPFRIRPPAPGFPFPANSFPALAR